MKMKSVLAGVFGGVSVLLVMLLFGFSNTSTPARAPVVPGSLSLSDLIYVLDTSAGGVTTGVPNVTGKNVFCDGTTALAYDAVTSHSFSCLTVDSANVDAGAPFGSVDVISGYNALTTAAVDSAQKITYYPKARPLAIGIGTEVGGVGAGTFTFELFDNTSSASLCISPNQNCNITAGSFVSVDCGPNYTATSGTKHDLILRFNCTGCTNCPASNIWAEMQTIPGS